MSYVSSMFACDPYFSDVILLMHCEGATWVDSSSYARTLTAYGGASLASSVTWSGSGAYLNTATDSTSRVATAANISHANTDSWTLEASIYPTTTGALAYRHIVQMGDSATDRFHLGINAGKLTAYCRFGAGAGEFSAIIDSVDLSLNNYYLVAAVFENKGAGVWDMHLYKNKARVGTASSVNMPNSFTSVYSIAVGTQHYTPVANDEFKGNIDEIRVTKRARYTGASYDRPDRAFEDVSC